MLKWCKSPLLLLLLLVRLCHGHRKEKEEAGPERHKKTAHYR